MGAVQFHPNGSGSGSSHVVFGLLAAATLAAATLAAATLTCEKPTPARLVVAILTVTLNTGAGL